MKFAATIRRLMSRFTKRADVHVTQCFCAIDSGGGVRLGLTSP